MSRGVRVQVPSLAPADMAESADALDSGSSRGNSVEVQVLLSAPAEHREKAGALFVFYKKSKAIVRIVKREDAEQVVAIAAYRKQSVDERRKPICSEYSREAAASKGICVGADG